jgi:hypothetical protein
VSLLPFDKSATVVSEVVGFSDYDFSGAADALQGLRSSFLLLALEPFRSPTQSFGRAAETHRLSAAAQKIRSGGQALIFRF